jgi:hypothetical protein
VIPASSDLAQRGEAQGRDGEHTTTQQCVEYAWCRCGKHKPWLFRADGALMLVLGHEADDAFADHVAQLLNVPVDSRPPPMAAPLADRATSADSPDRWDLAAAYFGFAVRAGGAA